MALALMIVAGTILITWIALSLVDLIKNRKR